MIRKVTEKDIPQLLKLLLSVNNVHAALRPDIFRPDTRKYETAELLSLLSDAVSPIYVFTDASDTALGYAFCRLEITRNDPHMTDRTVLYIDDICVAEAARGKGIGRTLCDFVTEEARRMGCDALTLNVWEGNDSAKALYSSCGFAPLKTTMEKKLR